MNIKKQIQGITLTEYNKIYGADPTASMYIMNRTGVNGDSDSPRGRVCFSIMGDLGQPATVIVPSTFIPVDLTTQATRDSLLKSSQFRSLLTTGQLVILDNRVAEELLTEDSRARAEHKRLFNSDFVATLDFDLDDNKPSQAPAPDMQDSVKDYSTNMFVNSIIQRCNSGEEDSDAIINAILNQADSLTDADLICISSNVTDSNVQDFCLENSKD